jgi:hypothetical protein
MRIVFVLLLSSFTFPLKAFVPDLGHIIRHQPNILKANPASFTVEGSIQIESESAPFTLSWAGMKSGYVVDFKKIPASWTVGNISELQLLRTPSSCVLLVNKTPHPCLPFRAWGDFEFNPNVEQIVKTLSSLGVAPASDLAFRSINAKEAESRGKSSKVQVLPRSVQGVLVSVLEYKGKNSTILGFDTLHYAPLVMRMPVEGKFWELTGSSDFNLEREDRRNNLIVSKRIELREASRLVGVVKREALKRGKATLPTVTSSGSVSEPPYGRFTEKGQDFLRVLSLTH